MNFKPVHCTLLSFALLELFLLVNNCGGQPANWKGTIRIENGIRIIKNPEEPIHGNAFLKLEEELSIGNENDKDYLFYKGVGILVDRNENIYALDYANLCIKKYDKRGNHIITMGSKGQGPGEFQYITWAFLDSNENMYVSQQRNISVFDNSGKFIKSIPLFNQIGPFGITRDKNIITSSLVYNSDGVTSDILIISPDGKTQNKLASFPIKKLRMKGNIPVGASNPFAPILFFRPHGEERGVYGFSAEYGLFVIDSMGHTVCIIEKKESPQSLTRNEKKQAIDRELDFLRSRRFNISRTEIEKAYDFPIYKPFFSGMIIDEQGNIYLMRLDEDPDGKKKYHYDYFSKDGYYLYRIVMDRKLFPQAIANNCVYAAHENEEKGYFEIKKYRIKNWK